MPKDWISCPWLAQALAFVCLSVSILWSQLAGEDQHQGLQHATMSAFIPDHLVSLSLTFSPNTYHDNLMLAPGDAWSACVSWPVTQPLRGYFMKVINVSPPPSPGLICLHGELDDGILSHCRSASGTGVQAGLQRWHETFCRCMWRWLRLSRSFKKPVTAFVDTAEPDTPAVIASGLSCHLQKLAEVAICNMSSCS